PVERSAGVFFLGKKGEKTPQFLEDLRPLALPLYFFPEPQRSSPARFFMAASFFDQNSKNYSRNLQAGGRIDRGLPRHADFVVVARARRCAWWRGLKRSPAGRFASAIGW